MARKSPLDDPQQAAHAWARFRRIMRMMFLFTVFLVLGALAVLYHEGAAYSVHVYLAVALGIGFTMLMAAGLMGLVFLSAGTGHDDSVGED